MLLVSHLRESLLFTLIANDRSCRSNIDHVCCTHTAKGRHFKNTFIYTSDDKKKVGGYRRELL